jgi:23S rRNA pseudouridine1911/1915/1917 synthase
VLEHLVASHRHSSSREWAARIRRGEVELNGVAANAEAVLRTGYTLVWRRPPWDEPDVPMHYELIHEDEAILAVNKPSGLQTMPAGGFLEHTLMALVRRRYPDASPLHRIGRFTSGLVLFARTGAAAQIVSLAWRDHKVKKQYRALGSGVAIKDRFEIDTPIGPVPHAVLGTIHGASPTGRRSHTVAHVIERRQDQTLFAVGITTGRPHQIRIHLAVAGHPLVGDPVYGPGGLPKPSPGLPGDGGFFLHAESLRFVHPLTEIEITLQAPPPVELRSHDGR